MSSRLRDQFLIVQSESSYFSDASNSDYDSDLIISDASCSDDDEGYGDFMALALTTNGNASGITNGEWKG